MPEDYATGAGRRWPQHGGATSLELRKALAAKAYARTAAYDAAIGGWFAETLGERAPALARVRRPAGAGAALRREPAPEGRLLSVGRARARAWPRPCSTRARSSPTTTSATPTPPSSWWPSSIRRSPRPSPSSSTPTRAASALGKTLSEAYAKALRCDPVSAFGGIIALNGPIDAATAREITGIFTEVVIAPGRHAPRPRPSSPRRRTCAC